MVAVPRGERIPAANLAIDHGGLQRLLSAPVGRLARRIERALVDDGGSPGVRRRRDVAARRRNHASYSQRGRAAGPSMILGGHFPFELAIAHILHMRGESPLVRERVDERAGAIPRRTGSVRAELP